MRTTLMISAALQLAASAMACKRSGEKASTPAAPSSSGAAAKAPSASSVAILADGEPVLRLTLEAGTKSYLENDGKNTFVGSQIADRFYLWVVSGAKTPSDAVSKVGHVIAGEFKDFEPTDTQEVEVAGAPATKLLGTGTEAADGDPGQAEVVLFAVGGHVFAACVHGEKISDAKRDLMMKTIETAR